VIDKKVILSVGAAFIILIDDFIGIVFFVYHFVRIPYYPYHFVRTICPLPFCPRTDIELFLSPTICMSADASVYVYITFALVRPCVHAV